MKKENKMLAAAAVLSFLSGFCFQQDGGYGLTTVGVFCLMVGAVVFFFRLLSRRGSVENRRLAVECGVAGVMVLCLMWAVCRLRQENVGEELMVGYTIGLAVFLVVGFLLCVWREKGITDNVVTLMIFSGFLIRLFYIVLTQAHLIQNDIEALAEECRGHLGYVYHIFTTWRLADLNPIGNYQFYHPPLHYLISALCLKVYELLGVEPEAWDEVLQALPLFYGTALLIYLEKLGQRLHCPPLGRFLTVGLAAFFPYSIFLGGVLNNDALATLLMVMCIYYTIKWYEEPDGKGIMIMAVCVGCAMMSKLSGAMVAPGMAVVMLWRLWKGRAQWRMFVKQFVCFGLAAFPLGLWYSVVCWVRYGMPFGYVLRLTEASEEQYLGMYSKWDRFRDYGYALETLYVRFGEEGTVDYNIPVTMVKFGVFNELHYTENTALAKLLGTMVFRATAVLFLLFAAAFLVWCFLREQKAVYKVFLGGNAVVILFAYVKFCFAYPHVCTMNIRYVMTAVYIGMLVLGLAAGGLHTRLCRRNVRAGRMFAGAVGGVTALYLLGCILLQVNLEVMLF